jgi:DNA-binding MarR family transcriptional regulator
MTKPSSTFLRGANAALSKGMRSEPAEGDVLTALAEGGAPDVGALALTLRTDPAQLQGLLDKLRAQGLIETDGGLRLSHAGERALRYSKMAF